MPATERPSVPDACRPALEALLLSVADDKLMLGHLNSDWTGLAPTLEEDIAFSALAQDDIAHAQAAYEYVARLTDGDADALAFGRTPEAYRSAAVCELADELDWAIAIARQFFVAHFEHLRLTRLSNSSEPELAALARRMLAEQSVQLEHVDGWVRRLGTDPAAHARLQAGLHHVGPLVPGLLESVAGESDLVDAGLYPMLDGGASMRERLVADLHAVTAPNGFTLPPIESPDGTAGPRNGAPLASRAALLDEMCEVYRSDPGAAW